MSILITKVDLDEPNYLHQVFSQGIPNSFFADLDHNELDSFDLTCRRSQDEKKAFLRRLFKVESVLARFFSPEEICRGAGNSYSSITNRQAVNDRTSLVRREATSFSLGKATTPIWTPDFERVIEIEDHVNREETEYGDDSIVEVWDFQNTYSLFPRTTFKDKATLILDNGYSSAGSAAGVEKYVRRGLKMMKSPSVAHMLDPTLDVVAVSPRFVNDSRTWRVPIEYHGRMKPQPDFAEANSFEMVYQQDTNKILWTVITGPGLVHTYIAAPSDWAFMKSSLSAIQDLMDDGILHPGCTSWSDGGFMKSTAMTTRGRRRKDAVKIVVNIPNVKELKLDICRFNRWMDILDDKGVFLRMQWNERK
ncbi:hypothetical protein C8J55DRAFT_494451 [Lentinula edodes]|uniref:Uncharacterized protein n=1 Tax=Lentinula lateritia TaxID=40482 RepID=A0A9W8ZPS2_9AGAR|nr:hypothetical protein C8J55DRAFT_494451 [Lentinula edodes]